MSYGLYQRISILFFVVFTFFTNQVKGQNEVIHGIIISQTDSLPIPFASIVNVTNEKLSAVTDENGNFTLNVSSSKSDDLIHISSLGYYDTLIKVDELTGIENIIRLKEKVYSLPEFVFGNANKTSKEITIGKELMEPSKQFFEFTVPGLTQGALIKSRHLKNSKLVQLGIHFNAVDQVEGKLAIRILNVSVEMANATLYPSDLFNDLLKEPIIITPKASGTHFINLEPYNLFIEDDEILILCVPLTKYDEASLKEENKEDLTLSLYEQKEKGIHAFRFYRRLDKYAFIKEKPAPAFFIKLIRQQ